MAPSSRRCLPLILPRPYLLVLLLPLLSLVSFLPLFPTAVAAADADFSTVSVSFTSDGSPQLAMTDLTSAYLLLQPDVSLSMTKLALSTAVITSLTSQSVDFGLLSSELSDSQALAYPNLRMYPTMASALVPIYRVDALGTDAPQLVLTRTVLSQIYMGEITWWNDSAIAATNPALTFPHQRITLVLPPGGSPNRIFTTALSKFYAPFNHTIGVSSAPVWPYASYYAHITASDVAGQAATVIANDGSLAYCFLATAKQASVNIAAMVNQVGTVVQANADSVTFATVELGTAPRSRTTALMDLTDATGASVWPITLMSFLLIDTAYSRSTCHARAAVVEFFLWFYTSSVASGLLAGRDYSAVPSVILTQLDVVGELTTLIECRGNVALAPTVSTVRVIAAPVSVAFFATLFAQSYTTQDASIVWQVQQNTDQVIVEQLVNAEVDIAFINPVNVDPALIQQVMADPTYLVMPTFLLADAVAYNPQLTPNISIAGYTLTLDMRTIGLIQFSCILHWNDPLILAQNPWLATLLPPLSLTPIVIMQILGCGAYAPLESALLDAISQYQLAADDDVLLQCMNSYPQALWDAWYECTSIPSLGLLYTPAEVAVPSLLLGTFGAMGAIQNMGDPSYGLVQITDYRDGVWSNTTADTAGMAACASDTFSAVNLFTNGNPLGLSPDSHNPQCYRATQQVAAIVRSNYSPTAADTSSCTRGYDSLAFLAWFITTPAIDRLTESVETVRVTSLSASIYNLELDALNQVVCQDQTLLVTKPVQWSLASGVVTFVALFSSLGVVACVGLTAFVVYYRHHPVIRSASPLFLLLSIFGLLVLFAAGYLLVESVTIASCAAFSWFINIGLMLTFSPLFAKTWRIYRIFGRRKLTVVALSNKKLLLMVAALMGAEVLIMAVWQGLGQLQPITNDVQTSTTTGSSVAKIANRLLVDEYVQCGVPAGVGQSMFVVVCVEKGLLFVWGALMAFTTRKVSSTFNEAQGITLALYNTCFTVGIIAPIILVIRATGDVLDLLLAFALLWIASFTGAVLFGPKVMTVLSKAEPAAGNNSVAASSSSSGYAFLSLATLSSVGVVQGYLAALKKHTAQVEERLTKLKKTHQQQQQFAGQQGAGVGDGVGGGGGLRGSTSMASGKASGDAEARVLAMGGGEAGPASPMFKATRKSVVGVGMGGEGKAAHLRARSSMSQTTTVGSGLGQQQEGGGGMSRSGSPCLGQPLQPLH